MVLKHIEFDWTWDKVGEGNGTPLQYSWLENPMDGGAWWAAIYGVAQSRTQLKWVSSSSKEDNGKTCDLGLLWRLSEVLLTKDLEQYVAHSSFLLIYLLLLEAPPDKDSSVESTLGRWFQETWVGE